MKLTCQHCATPFKEGTGEGAFCCSGCKQVYELIRAEGLGDYYVLQDRMGRPVGDVAAYAEGATDWRDLQKDAEQQKAELVLRVDGMSCLGCVWLVERLSRSEPGVLSARVSLQENRLVLKWQPGAFDLAALVLRLAGFGYTVGVGSPGMAARWSLLTWRLVLCGIFAVNGILLALPGWISEDVSAYADLLFLLSLAFTALSLCVGASHFVIPALRTWRIGLVHYDSLIVAGLLALFIDADASFLWELPILVFLLLGVRWIHLRVWACVETGVDTVVSNSAASVQAWVSILSLVAVLLECVLFLEGRLSAFLFAAPLYPFALIGRYQSRRGLLLLNIGLCVVGWSLVVGLGLSYFGALVWHLLSGLVLFANFAYWKSLNKLQ